MEVLIRVSLRSLGDELDGLELSRERFLHVRARVKRRAEVAAGSLGATDDEINETLDIGVLMGGTLAVKSVRHAFSVLEQLKTGRT